MTFIQGATSALDLFQDVGGAGRPNERLGILIVTIDGVSDGQDEFFEIAKHSASQPVVSEVAEETLHHVGPRRTRRSDVHVESWMACEPALHLGMLMGGVVVADQV